MIIFQYIQSLLLIIAAVMIIIAAIGLVSLKSDMKNVVYARIHIVGLFDIACIIALIGLGDLEKAQKGILIIDELDKLAESNSSSQVNQRDVQEALLKLIEDSKFDIDYHHQNISFDTSKLMVVGMRS